MHFRELSCCQEVDCNYFVDIRDLADSSTLHSYLVCTDCLGLLYVHRVRWLKKKVHLSRDLYLNTFYGVPQGVLHYGHCSPPQPQQLCVLRRLRDTHQPFSSSCFFLARSTAMARKKATSRTSRTMCPIATILQ